VKRKRVIWIIGLSVCALFIISLFVSDKPYVNGFTRVLNKTLVYVCESDNVNISDNDAISDYPLSKIKKHSFKYAGNMYLGYKGTVRVYDLNYHFLKDIALSALGIPEGLILYRPVKKESKSMWWTVGADLPDKETFSYPHGIVHIFLSNESLRADYYEIGEFAAAAVQEDGKCIYVFKEHQSSYEIYDIASKNFRAKVPINDYNMNFLIHLFYDDASNAFVVSGNGGIGGKFIIGYIKGQTFKLIDSAEIDWGTGGCLIADSKLFYNNDSRLFQVDLNSGIRTLVSAPKLGAFSSSFWNIIDYDRERNVLFFGYSYRNLIGVLNENNIIFNLSTKQYYVEKEED
jgi:hypothetical protein